MQLRGELYAESPIYRGNARKTLFTRDGDGQQRLVSLAGEIAGTAQSLMDAFVGKSRNGRNIGLLNQLWLRLYDESMPDRLVSRVRCSLEKDSYPRDNFFDLRMGIRLDEDRWAAEANANYKMETLYRNSVFNFEMMVNDAALNQGENKAKLYYMLEELRAGRFWFGAGKSKGLGRCRLNLKFPFEAPEPPRRLNKRANHLSIKLSFDATNPVLVGWNWGKIDPHTPAFAAVEGRMLLAGLRTLPEAVGERLQMTIGGPILSPESWKKSFAQYLPQVMSIWLQENSRSESEAYVLPASALAKLGKGKHPLAQKLLDKIQPLVDQPHQSQENLQNEITKRFGKKANMAKRVFEYIEHQTQETKAFDASLWENIAARIGFEKNLGDQVASAIEDEQALTDILTKACLLVLPDLNQQIDHQIKLLQSDNWVNVEIASREAHMEIKMMLMHGQIREHQWGRKDAVPDGVRAADWQEFVDAHPRVQYHHMRNRQNLEKSMTNDRNHIAFLKAYRARTRQELSQPHHIDFRIGGGSNRNVSRKFGKPYDNIFMRMLSWKPSSQESGGWEVYISGGTIKGAFRKRASMLLKTMLGESGNARNILENLFGAQGRRGMILFSDAYLAHPDDPEKDWCSMDGVRMDPTTAQPVEEAKSDYLFAYGNHLKFNLRLDAQNLSRRDAEAWSLLTMLIKDFQNGDIVIGGEKSNGFGWVKGDVAEIEWLSTADNGLGKQIVGDAQAETSGLWQAVRLSGSEVEQGLRSAVNIFENSLDVASEPPKSAQGFISHRAFGGFCGELHVEGEVLTPLTVQESGEPSFQAEINGEKVNGWDCFSFSPCANEQRGEQRTYALPSKSIRGLLRHVYSAASDSQGESQNISRLNPADSLFGWVGTGQNQAITARLAISFGTFEAPSLHWYKAPYPYGAWRFENGEWKKSPKGRVVIERVANHWRFFRHAPLAPIVKSLDAFEPDTVQAGYFRAVEPGAKCNFTIRFWNLTRDELSRLIWSIELENSLAHKMGKSRYLGFGSLRFRISEKSYLTNWKNRYGSNDGAGGADPLNLAEWRDDSVITNLDSLRKMLDADSV